MNEYRFLTSFYNSLHEKPWMHPNFYTPLRRVTRKVAAKRLPRYFENNPVDTNKCRVEKGVIASFTSFPARIEHAHMIVQCMFHQTVRPEKVFLWLSKEQFRDKSVLPSKLLALENECFEIRMVEGDIRSHKKYYYVCKEFPKAKILLLDDDIIYHYALLERLLFAYNNGDAQIICNYSHLIQRDTSGKLLPYKKWKPNYTETKGDEVFFGSGGGTLMRACDFDPILTNIELAQKLTPIADDIWLNSIARYSKLTIKMISHGAIMPLLIENNKCLYTSNVIENQNDIQLKNICNHFCTENFKFDK